MFIKVRLSLQLSLQLHLTNVTPDDLDILVVMLLIRGLRLLLVSKVFFSACSQHHLSLTLPIVDTLWVFPAVPDTTAILSDTPGHGSPFVHPCFLNTLAKPIDCQLFVSPFFWMRHFALLKCGTSGIDCIYV